MTATPNCPTCADTGQTESGELCRCNQLLMDEGRVSAAIAPALAIPRTNRYATKENRPARLRKSIQAG